MCKENVAFSKYLSFLLRHHPEEIDLNMDNQGWVLVDELIEKVNNNTDFNVDLDMLKSEVKLNSKQRFALEDREGILYIRANQGHSIKKLDMQYESIKPPKVLYHGTGAKYINSILKNGLISKNRQYVHLSKDIKTAKSVGSRHGSIRVLEIDAERMYNDGMKFYCSENGVWLTLFVYKKYLRIMTREEIKNG